MSRTNYVVNAICARLDDLRTKPITQQYVRRSDGYALIDLYFPQLNYGVECDEAYHKDNTLKDAEREIDLRKALPACSANGLTIRRIDATLDADTLITTPAAADGETLYTVKAGGTLGAIAKAAYGDLMKYKAILSATPTVS